MALNPNPFPPQDCQPLVLTAPNGTQFDFRGVAALVKGIVDPDAILNPPDSIGDPSQTLNPAQVANQALLRARALVTEYYNGWVECVDEDAPPPKRTRNVSLRPVHNEDGQPQPQLRGSAHPDPQAAAPMRQSVSEEALYLQLTHLHRLFDVEGTLKRLGKAVDRRKAEEMVATLAAPFGAAAQAISSIRDQSKYRWVDLAGIFGFANSSAA